MAASVLGALEKLYGSPQLADCTIRMVEPASDDKPESVLESLPGHLFVIQAGSELFRAQAERWSQQEECEPATGNGAAGRAAGKRKRDEADGEELEEPSSSSWRTCHGGSGPQREVLRVVLDFPADLPFALNAIHYLYSGNLKHVQSAPESGGSLAAALLHTRRLALYLQMPDCVTACETELVERVRDVAGATGRSSSAGGVQPPTSADAALDAVKDMFAARELLAPPQEPSASSAVPGAGAGGAVGADTSGADPGAAALSYRLHMACLEELVGWAKANDSAIEAENEEQHATWQQQREQQLRELGVVVDSQSGAAGVTDASSTAPPPPGPAPPTFGELLAWAVCSAPHALTDPGAKKLVLQLPAAGLEALLLAETFATDDESTVLLLLVRWFAVAVPHPAPVQLAVLQRLLRLSHMNEVYLLRYLPLLAPWLQLSEDETGLLAQCCGGSAAKRRRIRRAARHLPSVREGARWFDPTPRPPPPPRVLDWSIAATKLAGPSDELVEAPEQLVAKGFEWGVGAMLSRGTVLLSLTCNVPNAFELVSEVSADCTALAAPGSLELVLFKELIKWCIRCSTAGMRRSCSAARAGDWGGRVKRADGPQQQQPQSQQQQQQQQKPVKEGVGAWEPFVHEGRLRGQLRWQPEPEPPQLEE